jgi:hypothetical protein
MEIYWAAFKNWELEDFKKACNIVMQTRVVYASLPKIPEITQALYGKEEDRAALAYQLLVKAMRDIGPWHTVIFEDGAIGRAVQVLGGWEAVNEWSIDEWKFRRKDFESLYLANLRAGNTKPVRLDGAFDRLNAIAGFKSFNPPVLITRDRMLLVNKAEQKETAAAELPWIEDEGAGTSVGKQ